MLVVYYYQCLTLEGRLDLSIFVEGFPFIPIQRVRLYGAESVGVIAPIMFYRGPKLGIAVAAVGGLKVRVLAIENLRAIARL